MTVKAFVETDLVEVGRRVEGFEGWERSFGARENRGGNPEKRANRQNDAHRHQENFASA
jgi:hypothetical protein